MEPRFKTIFRLSISPLTLVYEVYSCTRMSFMTVFSIYLQNDQTAFKLSTSVLREYEITMLSYMHNVDYR